MLCVNTPNRHAKRIGSIGDGSDGSRKKNVCNKQQNNEKFNLTKQKSVMLHTDEMWRNNRSRWEKPKNKLLMPVRHVRSHVRCFAELLIPSYANVATCIWRAYGKVEHGKSDVAPRRVAFCFFFFFFFLFWITICCCSWGVFVLVGAGVRTWHRQSKWRSIAKVFSCRKLLYDSARAVLRTCLPFFFYPTNVYHFGNSWMRVLCSFERIKRNQTEYNLIKRGMHSSGNS